MRTPRERRLESRGPGSDERNIGGAQSVGRMAIEKRQRQLLEPEPVDGCLEPVARRPCRERDEKACVRPHRMECLGGPQDELAVHLELR